MRGRNARAGAAPRWGVGSAPIGAARHVPRPTQLIVFDLDGTLLDTAEPLADLAADLIADRWGWPWGEAREAFVATSGAPLCEQLGILFGHRQRALDTAFELEACYEALLAGVEMSSSVRRALWRLRGQGYQLAVSSNSSHNLVSDVLFREAPGAFDAICGWAEGFAKGPQHVALLGEQLDVGPEQCLMVGDELSDLLRARQAGAPFVGLTGTYRRQDFRELDPDVRVLDAVAELPRVLAAQPAAPRATTATAP